MIELYGVPHHIRSDNGAQFTSRAVMIQLRRLHIKTAFVESLHDRLRDEYLNMHSFSRGWEAEMRIEMWRKYYNTQRRHSSLDYTTPESERQKYLSVNSQSTNLDVA